MKDRINKLRTELGLSQQEFADIIRINRSMISLYESGAKKPRDVVVQSICREFNVNEKWLRTGEGEMFNLAPKENELAILVGNLLEEIVDDEPKTRFKRRLIEMLLKLDENEWERLQRFAGELVENE